MVIPFWLAQRQRAHPPRGAGIPSGLSQVWVPTFAHAGGVAHVGEFSRTQSAVKLLKLGGVLKTMKFFTIALLLIPSAFAQMTSVPCIPPPAPPPPANAASPGRGRGPGTPRTPATAIRRGCGRNRQADVAFPHGDRTSRMATIPMDPPIPRRPNSLNGSAFPRAR